VRARLGRAAAGAGLLLLVAACGGSEQLDPVTMGPVQAAGVTAVTSAPPGPGMTSAPAGAASAATAPQAIGAAAGSVLRRVIASSAPHVDAVSEVAQAAGASVPVYRNAADATPWMTLRSPLPSGAPLVFLVQEDRGDRLRVLLAVRPNGSQGWVHLPDVTLSQHDYRILVSASRHALTLYRGNSVVLTAPVGIGRAATPTPGGVFYTKELLRPADPNGAYGPYAYGLSGFSPVLTEFVGGDGEIGLHGTDDPAGLGRDVSHGCIRVSNTVITRLAGILPLGVPVQIVA